MGAEQAQPGGTGGDPAAPGWGRPRAVALGFLALFLVLYALLFAPLHRVLDLMSPSVSVVVPVVAGAVLGWRWGAVLGFLCMPMNVLLLASVGDGRFSPIGHAVGAVFFAAAGAAVGRVREQGALRRRSQAELQAQLAAAERLVTVGTLAAGVAHEINNPLSSVISNLEFVLEDLRRQAPESPARSTALAAAAAEALQGAERVSGIVRDLMAFARPMEEAGPVDVERVLDLSVNMAASQTRYRARVVKQYARVPPAIGDASRLGQVFLNLLVNAAQAIPAGHPDEHEIRVATRLEGERIAVSVHDTGAGMAPEVRRRIFEPFFTTKPVGSGMGLGLSTSLAAVRAMGGDIVAESQPGGGSTFTVTLPATAPSPRRG